MFFLPEDLVQLPRFEDTVQLPRFDDIVRLPRFDHIYGNMATGSSEETDGTVPFGQESDDDVFINQNEDQHVPDVAANGFIGELGVAIEQQKLKLHFLVDTGAYACVYMVTYNEQPYAYKCYQQTVNWREIKIHKQLSHENLANFIDIVFEETDRASGFLMELYSWNLRRFYKDGRSADISELVSWARGLAKVLDYLHKKGYCHWDVNPNNVVISNDRAAIIDLGLARKLCEWPPHVGGTPGYIAPEVISYIYGPCQTAGPSQICGQKADVYSFGKTLYFMFAKRDWPNTENKKAAFTLLQCPDNVRELIEKCTNGNPRNRPFMSFIVTTLLLVGMVFFYFG